MVGPVPGDRQRLLNRRLALGAAALVGLSAALTALYSGAGPLAVGVAGVAGLLVGLFLLLVLGVRP